MSRNGSGVYSLAAGNPVVTGTTISSTWANNTLSDIATALTQSIAYDGQTTPVANLPMGGYNHTNVANATARTQYASAGQVEDGTLNYLTSVSGTNAITATAPVSMSAYVAGQTFRFIAAGANTGAVTLNLNAIGAKAVTRDGTTALVTGDILAGGVYQVTYDGTQFQLTNSSNASVQVTSFSAGTTGFTPSTATNGAVTLAGTLATTNGGTGLTSFTSGGAVYASSTSALTTGILPEASGGTGTTTGYYGFKNRIINGSMMIDQRNAGASVTPNGSYTLDRWVVYNSQTGKLTVQQNAGSVTPPAGFKNYLGVTSSSAYTVGTNEIFILGQAIEGFNTADLGFGAVGASTVTVSFWVRSSLTGTFGGCLDNSADNRTYPFSYTINSANTWEYKTVTIAGDTTGTWVGATNGAGIILYFSLGAGSGKQNTANTWAAGSYVAPTGAVNVVATNGATFYITGVQLEKGSTATSFDYRPYGQELALCQRYYQKIDGFSAMCGNGVTTIAYGTTQFPVTMRASPSAGATAVLKLTDTSADYTQSSASVAIMLGTRVSPTGFEYQLTNFTGMTALRPLFSIPNETGSITLSAEL